MRLKHAFSHLKDTAIDTLKDIGKTEEARKVKRFKLQYDAEMDVDHEEDPRRYAATDYNVNRVLFARATDELPDEHKFGLILHELGHCALGPEDHTEEDADQWSVDTFGIEIVYDQFWPGIGLQCIEPEDVDDLLGE